MIVQSFGTLQALTNPARWAPPTRALTLNGLNQSYARIYATQPNVRICVDFLARNIAHLAPQVFRRVSDTDRERLVDHDIARWLGKPNPATRRYRLIESLVGDLGVYFNAYWLKARVTGTDGRAAIGLVRLPPEELEVKGGLLPTHFCWTANGQERDFPLSELVYFNGYNPLNPLMGLSPLETLRRILAEEAAAGEHRESFWRNAGRHEGVIERPVTAPKWTKTQKDSWREQYQEFAGGGGKAGQTVVLEDGMTYKATSWSAKDSEYTLGGKLRREVCAAAFHIPQPFVGILEHATFSNVKEQHKHLYQDTLGPWLEMIQQEIEGQLLVESDDQRDVYVEFNIDAKLAGTPEERAQSIQLSTGKPWRTTNEARALDNLPRDEDPASDRIAPQQGGPAAAATSADAPPPARQARPPAAADPTGDARILQATRERQHARLARVPVVDRPAVFTADLERWNRELAADLAAVTGADETARAAAQNADTLHRLEADELHARIGALERRPTIVERRPVAVRRSFDRDPVTGLVQTFTDTPVEDTCH